MSYNISLTNNTVIGTIADGTYDSTYTSLKLVGRNYSNYGQYMTDNLVHLLENFASTSAPLHPLNGQLWWDVGSNALKAYYVQQPSGTATWKTVGGATYSGTAPSLGVGGDMWWDSNNQQLYVYSGSDWVLVGPTYKVGLGKSGAIWETISDGTLNHDVVSIYLDGTRTAVIVQNTDSTFTPSPSITGFSVLNPGYNMAGGFTVWGTANNASYFNGLNSSQFLRTTGTNNASGNLNINNDVGISVGASNKSTFSISGTDLKITNTTTGGLVGIWATTGGTATRYLNINGSTGVVEVAADPSTTLGIATKNYVDNKFTNTVLYGTPVAPTPLDGDSDTSIATTQFVANAISINRSATEANVAYKANIASPVLTGNPQAPTPAVGDNDTSIATTAFVYQANVGLKGYSDTQFSLKANINSPTFTGNPQAPTASYNDASISIATTQFVATANTSVVNYINSVNSAIGAQMVLRANIASPTFTGNPQAPTPLVGDNDTSIATTAFVQTAILNSASSGDANVAYKANIASPTLTGNPQAPTPAVGDNTTSIATTAFNYQSNVGLRGYVDNSIATVNSTIVLRANIASPTFTGNPQAPTPSIGDNDTSIATTAFVYQANVAQTGYNAGTYAPINNPVLTGNPQVPTATYGNSSPSVASTAFVQGAINVVNAALANVTLNSIYQNNSSLTILDSGAGNLTLSMDGSTVLTATASGVVLASGAVAATQSQTYNASGNTYVATTGYVKTATTWWGGSAKFVSTSAPNPGVNDTGSNNGDFWFQLSS